MFSVNVYVTDAQSQEKPSELVVCVRPNRVSSLSERTSLSPSRMEGWSGRVQSTLVLQLPTRSFYFLHFLRRVSDAICYSLIFKFILFNMILHYIVLHRPHYHQARTWSSIRVQAFHILYLFIPLHTFLYLCTFFKPMMLRPLHE